MSKEPVKVKELESSVRLGGFDEVVLGYNEEEALKEASRCLQCKNPVCVTGCPVGIDIKGFIKKITDKDYKGAYLLIRERNNFPSICGRVCPAEYQCRKACVLSKRGGPFASPEAINIHFLERFIGDYGMKSGLSPHAVKDKKLSGYKVAVVGSGPAGLCAAGELARRGVRIVMYEGLHREGGVLRYGIPPFRLSRDVLDYEIEELKKLGVEMESNCIIGKTLSMAELFEQGYDAVFLGLGAGTPVFLGLPGENLCNVYSANEFLTRVNLMAAYRFPEYHTPVNVGKRISVIGGGNTAMDAARVALRLQKMSGIEPDTTILYRRTEIEMPARRLEIEHAKEEGVKFDILTRPLEFLGNDEGFVKGIECIKCELGECDSSGRRRPVDMKGSEFALDCDMAVMAIGLNANSVLTKANPDIKTDKYGDIIADKETMETSVRDVFAGGDIVGGEGTVIEAMGMAKKAAESIIKRLSEKK